MENEKNPTAQHAAQNIAATTDSFIWKKAYLQDWIQDKTGLRHGSDFILIESQTYKHQRIVVKALGNLEIAIPRKQQMEALFEDDQTDLAPHNPKVCFLVFLKKINLPAGYKVKHMPPPENNNQLSIQLKWRISEKVIEQMHFEAGILGVRADKQPKPEEGKTILIYFNEDHLTKAQEYFSALELPFEVGEPLCLTFDLSKIPDFTPKEKEQLHFGFKRTENEKILSKDESRIALIVWELKNRFHLVIETQGVFKDGFPESTEFVLLGNKLYLDDSLKKLTERYQIEFVRSKDPRQFKVLSIESKNTKQVEVSKTELKMGLAKYFKDCKIKFVNILISKDGCTVNFKTEEARESARRQVESDEVYKVKESKWGKKSLIITEKRQYQDHPSSQATFVESKFDKKRFFEAVKAEFKKCFGQGNVEVTLVNDLGQEEKNTLNWQSFKKGINANLK